MSQAALKAKVAQTGTRVITGKLFRHRRSDGCSFEDQPPAPPPEPVRRPARVALMLALAWKIREAIDEGVVESQTEVAERLGLTRARVTQLLDLTLLPVAVQERVLFLEAVDGVEVVTERGLRGVVRGGDGEAWLHTWEISNWSHRPY